MPSVTLSNGHIGVVTTPYRRSSTIFGYRTHPCCTASRTTCWHPAIRFNNDGKRIPT